jgi:valyl-tRNA synthetase
VDENALGGQPEMLEAVAAALAGIRGAKSNAKVSMRAELSRVEIAGPGALVTAAEAAAEDLRKVGKVTGDLVFTTRDDLDELVVTADLADQG